MIISVLSEKQGVIGTSKEKAGNRRFNKKNG